MSVYFYPAEKVYSDKNVTVFLQELENSDPDSGFWTYRSWVRYDCFPPSFIGVVHVEKLPSKEAAIAYAIQSALSEITSFCTSLSEVTEGLTKLSVKSVLADLTKTVEGGLNG